MSFQKAIEIGCQRTELDVWMTKDNHIIVFHDEEIDRVTDGYGKIENMTLAEIKKLNVQGQKIATLQEVIDLCKGRIDLQIELKGKNTPLPVNKLVVKNAIESQVLITSFDIELLKEIKNNNPHLYTGLLFSARPDNLWRLAKEIPLNYICPKASTVEKETILTAHEFGLKVYAYHANSYALVENLIQWNIDDIGTDYPNLFL